MSQPNPESQPDPADRSAWGPAPQPGSRPAPAPARSRSKRAALAGVLVFALAVAAAVGIVRTFLLVPAEKAAAGQCIQDPEKHQSPVITDCDSDDAAYRVTAPAGSTCAQVPGTTTIYETMCLIGTEEDPSLALNSAKVGDCLDIDAISEQAAISECTSGTHPILMILDDVSKGEIMPLGQDACQKAGVDAGAYDHPYAWSFTRFQSASLKGLDLSNTYDYAFCLGHPNP